MIERFVRALTAADAGLDDRQIAESLWLARHLPVGRPAETAAGAEQADTPVPQAVARAEKPAGTPPLPAPPPVPPSGASAPADTGGRLYAAPERAGSVRLAADPVKIPATAALPHTLALGRSLRPLGRRRPSLWRRVFDEEATVRHAADGGPLVPRFHPAPERWFDVCLVVEHTSSMIVWERTLAELEKLLVRHGAFRDIHVWRAEAVAGNLRLTSRSGRPGSPRELIEGTGRRLVMVVSDCVSPGWRDGTFGQAIRLWSERMAVVVAQTLPRPMWPRTALGRADLLVSAPVPGVPGSRLQVDLPPWVLDPPGDVPCVPVVTLEAGPLACWARMLADPGHRAPAAPLPLPGTTEEPEGEEDEPPPEDANGKVLRFRAMASPAAFKLATCLTAVPLTLPVMRLVQRTMLPDSVQVHLAELLLGGIIERVTPASMPVPADGILFDFHEGVRDRLCALLPRSDFLRVLEAVSELVERRAGHPVDFDALLGDAEGAQPLAEAARPFAEIASTVWQRLGGRRRRMVPAQPVSKDADPWLQDLRDLVAKGQIIVVVGAGVSIAATAGAATSSWAGLLHDGVKRCVTFGKPPPPEGWARRAHEALQSGDTDELLGYAVQIGRRLGAPHGVEYARWLRETMGVHRITDDSLLRALGDLGLPIVTNNYDSLLSEATGLRPVTWKDPAAVRRALTGEDKAIIHLYGHWEQPDSIMLGAPSYAEVRGTEHAQLMHALADTTPSLLFVGCGHSMRDHYIDALLAAMTERWGADGHRHYHLCRTDECDELRREHRPEHRILPIAFGPTYSDLAPFLRDLARRPAPAPPRIPDPVIEPAPARRPKPHLPGKPWGLFGRDAVFAHLMTALLSDAPEPISVLGGPGIGKTALISAALHDPRVVARYGERRYLVSLDGARTGVAICSEIATTLGLPPGPDPLGRVLATLAETPTLLMLDNAETPLKEDRQGTENVLARITDLPGLVLVVSIRGNSLPFTVEWDESIHVGRLPAADAHALFLAVAGRPLGDDAVLEKLLDVLDGVPLTVETMGYAARSVSLNELWQRWQNEPTAMLHRTKTGFESLAVPYEASIRGPRMTVWAARLLSMLGLLPDGIAYGDLNALLPNEGGRAAATLREVGLAFHEGTRLRIPTPLRNYVAAHHLPTPNDWRCLIGHYTALATEGSQAGRVQGAEAIARLIPEIANVEAVVLLALEGRVWQEAIQAALGFGEFVRSTGYGTPKLLEHVVEIATRRGGQDQAVYCVRSLGDIALARSDFNEARKRYQEAWQLFQRVGNVQDAAGCVRSLGDVALARSDFNEARKRYQEAWQLFQRIGDTQGEASCLISFGNGALACSDLDEARGWYERALALYRLVGDAEGEGKAVRGIGDIAARFDHDKARSRYEAALALFERIASPLLIGETHQRLAKIARSDEERRRHLTIVRNEWRSVGLTSLISALDAEFGSGS